MYTRFNSNTMSKRFSVQFRLDWLYNIVRYDEQITSGERIFDAFSEGCSNSWWNVVQIGFEGSLVHSVVELICLIRSWSGDTTIRQTCTCKLLGEEVIKWVASLNSSTVFSLFLATSILSGVLSIDSVKFVSAMTKAQAKKQEHE